MITKERLQELIEQGATIYSVDDSIVLEIKANELYYSKSNDNYQYNEYFFVYEFNEEDLFETKEEAEFVREFGCIERTERLELPTWEEVSRDLKDVPAGSYVIKEFDDVSLEYSKYNEVFIGIYKSDYSEDWEATKENYTLACRKAKELFLGEKK